MYKCLCVSVYCAINVLLNVLQEGGSLIRNPKDYYSDPWNYIDTSIVGLVCLFLGTLNYNVWTGIVHDGIFQSDMIRTYGAVCAWFMWIKVFYWMRIFRSLAYFISII